MHFELLQMTSRGDNEVDLLIKDVVAGKYTQRPSSHSMYDFTHR